MFFSSRILKKKVFILVIDQTLIDNATRVFDRMFEYTNNKDISLAFYGEKDFLTVADDFLKTFNHIKTYKTHFKVKYLRTTKSFRRDSKFIVFTVLFNNMNINNVSWQMNTAQSLLKTNYKRDIFQIFIDCHYTNFHEMIDACKTAIIRSIDKKFSPTYS